MLKLRSPQLGCGHSLETQLQILASVHPWLLAPGGITREAGFQTRTHGTVSWNIGKTGPWSFPLVLTEIICSCRLTRHHCTWCVCGGSAWPFRVCPSVHVFEHSVPTSGAGTIWGQCGTFWTWDLVSREGCGDRA